MADSSFSFHDAKRQLEKEMMDRQLRLINILTDQSDSLAAETELLENEIENRNVAIQKLEAQRCCDGCGVQVQIPDVFCVRITKYSAKMPPINLAMEKVRVRAECADCSSKYDLQYEPQRVVATTTEILRAIEMLACSKQWQDLKRLGYRRAQRFPANLGAC